VVSFRLPRYCRPQDVIGLLEGMHHVSLPRTTPQDPHQPTSRLHAACLIDKPPLSLNSWRDASTEILDAEVARNIDPSRIPTLFAEILQERWRTKTKPIGRIAKSRRRRSIRETKIQRRSRLMLLESCRETLRGRVMYVYLIRALRVRTNKRR
jgi:hypothetical protein